MRVQEPKRPGKDVGNNFEQAYKWMYSLTEQLNMALEQLERNNVLDLQANFGTTSAKGLLSETVADTQERLLSIQGSQAQQAEQIGQIQQIQTQLGEYQILTGIGVIPYGTGAEREEASIVFEQAFSTPPVVLVSQVFNESNLIVRNESVTETGFDVWMIGTFSSSGTRNFSWIAIGKKEV